ncbi:MAG: methyltransferase domain-containing protein [Planctomycetota bacterium]|nr:methyltransferase domain-containing protein [Planctomycetota bacterium]MDA1138538.1 methyltransferase domain-containing protein [Planctomycetota bacterium]
MSNLFPPNSFTRQDESEDEIFFQEPRKVVHIDEPAIEAVRDLYREFLPPRGRILDLMSSWRSHLPEDADFEEVVGLGMNAVEMEDNPQLDRFLIHNLNLEPSLPFEDASFDGVVCTVSVQYLVRAVEVFTEVGRILRPDCPFLVTFSNRCFPTKAVRLWCYSDDAQHDQIVRAYATGSDKFVEIESLDRSPSGPDARDPVFAVKCIRGM